MYAYKIGSPGEAFELGFADDNEINGVILLMNLIENEKLTNTFLCVTRIKNGRILVKIALITLRTVLNMKSKWQNQKMRTRKSKNQFSIELCLIQNKKNCIII